MVKFGQTKTKEDKMMEIPFRLLMALDEDEANAGLASAFESEGFHVILCAKNGLEVLKRIEAAKPDAVIMDLFMPGMDALGVLNTWKNQKKEKKPAFMIVSNVSNPVIEKETVNAGALYLAIRPFDGRSAAAILRSFLNGGKESADPVKEDADLQLKINDESKVEK